MDNMENKLKQLAASENMSGFSPGFSERVLERLPVFSAHKTENEIAWPSLWTAFKRVSFAGAVLGLVLAALNIAALSQSKESGQNNEMNYSVNDVMEEISDEIYEVVF